MEITRDYLESLSYEELLELYRKYDNISHNASRYDVDLSIQYANERDYIKEEMERRYKLNNDKPVIDSSKKRIK